MSTKIEWTQETWNPVTGCTKITDGCKNCYAERMAKRLAGRFGYPLIDPFALTIHHDKFYLPLKWKTPRMILVCSMGDLFHEEIAEVFQKKIFNVMMHCHDHTFQVLTKRPHTIEKFMNRYASWYEAIDNEPLKPNHYKNIWFGSSFSTQHHFDEVVYNLRRIPANVRFVSLEPLLEKIDIELAYDKGESGLHGIYKPVEWVIVGSESGPGRRPAKFEWIESIVNQCYENEIPVFVKQIELNGKLERDINKFPKHLQIRQYPK